MNGFKASLKFFLLPLCCMLWGTATASAGPEFHKVLSSKSSDAIMIRVDAFPDRERVRLSENFRFFVVVHMPPGWHIYSLNQGPVGEEVATRIDLQKTAFKVHGGWQESTPQLTKDEVLGQVLKTHHKRAEFFREFRVPGNLTPGTYFFAGSLTYRTCDNKVCTLPQTKHFRSRVILEDR